MFPLSFFVFVVTVSAVEGNETTAPPSPYEISVQNGNLSSTHPTSSLYGATETAKQHFKDEHVTSTSTSSCTLVCNETTLETSDLDIVSSNITKNSIQLDDKIPLYISTLYEGPGGGWDGSGCVPAIQMALDDINDREDILPEYELRPIWNDTKVNFIFYQRF